MAEMTAPAAGRKRGGAGGDTIDNSKRRAAVWRWVVLLAAAVYFLVPLYAAPCWLIVDVSTLGGIE